MSQLVRLEGKHTAQTELCAVMLMFVVLMFVMLIILTNLLSQVAGCAARGHPAILIGRQKSLRG